ncbi:MAG: Fe-S cluster assembly protein SufB [Candidatus Woesearchaeota archaeon]|nr:MAG: Fe-S cluster assembly protein SufB [Candidatus Woesearchaeota archaeon]
MMEQLSIREDYKTKYGFNEDVQTIFSTNKGINEEVINKISSRKKESQWLKEFRLKALKAFFSKSMPQWGADLNRINFDDIIYYLDPLSKKSASNWKDVPEKIKNTFERLGIPEAERKFLSGVGAQFDSEMAYHKIREDLEKQGVIFVDPDMGLSKYKNIFRKWFGKIVPILDNKFAALNSAFFSGGSFIYVPPNIKVALPLQAYFRINSESVGQFERTLIIVDKNAELTYIEGCTAPSYSKDSLHSAVVELVALEGAKLRYITLQNWSDNVYNLVTKRAFAYKNARVEWIDANLGAKVTMKYPSVYMMEPGASADILSIAYAGKNQHQDTGGKAVHYAPNTTSRIISKSVSKDGGRGSYRGLVEVRKGCTGVKSTVRCDALLLDELSRSDTYPTMKIEEEDATISHEAYVGKIGEEQLFYLMSKGLTEQEAMAMIVLGFVSEFTKTLPMEYAIEFNKLIELNMEGAVG